MVLSIVSRLWKTRVSFIYQGSGSEPREESSLWGESVLLPCEGTLSSPLSLAVLEIEGKELLIPMGSEGLNERYSGRVGLRDHGCSSTTESTNSVLCPISFSSINFNLHRHHGCSSFEDFSMIHYWTNQHHRVNSQ